MQGPQKDGKRLAEYFKQERHYESPRLLVCPSSLWKLTSRHKSRSIFFVRHPFFSLLQLLSRLGHSKFLLSPRQRLPLSPPNKLIPKDWGFVQEDEESPIIINSSKTLLSPLFLARNNKNLEGGGGHLVRLASDTARLLHPPTFIASHFLYWLTSSLVFIPMSTKWWPHGFYRRRVSWSWRAHQRTETEKHFSSSLQSMKTVSPKNRTKS